MTADPKRLAALEKRRLEQKQQRDRLTTEQLRLANDKARARRFGISYEQLLDLRHKQDGCCGICGKELRRFERQPGTYKRVGNKADYESIDHDHVTGRVRGLLCPDCNTSLGKLGDNVAGLEKAIAWVGEPADPDCF